MLTFIYVIDRFLTPQINDQVTEPLIETINTLSGLISPILMVQSIIQASKNEANNRNNGFNIHDAMNPDLNSEDQPIMGNSSSSITGITEEDEENEEAENIMRETDYIDVSEQGTISNASRLDRVLKDRERSKLKRNKKNSMELIDALSHEDISYLFDPNLSTMERELLFTKFEIPVSGRNQLVGALTAINILLENDQVIGNVVTGDTFKNPMLDVLDDIMIDIDDIDSSIYGGRKGVVGLPKNSIAASIQSAEAFSRRPLPAHIRQLVQNIVHMVLYPTLEEWAVKHYTNYPLHTITESKAKEMYSEVIQWMKAFAEPPNHKQDFPYTPMSSDDEYRSSGSSDSFGLARYQRQRELLSFRSIQPQNTRPQYRNRRSNYSSDSGDDDDDSDGDMISVYPRKSRKIESAAERLGETRRKGEHFDLDDMLSVSYATQNNLGFSNRALVLLSSLIRYGTYCQLLLF